MKVRIEGGRRGESMLPEEQNPERKLVLPETIFNLSGEKQLFRNVNSMQESDYPTEESKKKFIHENLKIDENQILNQDQKLKEEVLRMFLDNQFLYIIPSVEIQRKNQNSHRL